MHMLCLLQSMFKTCQSECLNSICAQSPMRNKSGNCLVSQMIVSLFIESTKFLRKMSRKMIDIFVLRHIIGPDKDMNSNRILYRPKNVSFSQFFNDFCITRSQKTDIFCKIGYVTI